jgi:hypothetical protein
MWKRRALYALLLSIGTLAVLGLLVQHSRSQERQTSYLRWEYHVLQYGPTACAGDELPSSLNAAGAEGWEMVSFTAVAKGPSEIVLQTASLGYGKEVVPNLTDSWQGIISPVQEAGCQVILKRPIE